MLTGEIRSQVDRIWDSFCRGRAGGGSARAERERPRTAQSFCVVRSDLVAQGFDLSISRYGEIPSVERVHVAPSTLLAELAEVEDEITRGFAELGEMLK